MATNEINHLLYARHRENEHQVTGLTDGWTDTPFTVLRRNEVSVTAVYLRTSGFSNIGLYRSGLQRTMESADVMGSISGCTPVPLAEFRGLDNGDAAQLTQKCPSRLM